VGEVPVPVAARSLVKQLAIAIQARVAQRQNNVLVLPDEHKAVNRLDEVMRRTALEVTALERRLGIKDCARTLRGRAPEGE
jgi:hypothetical protein